ncbi:MAG TPA: DNA (cytosine-5-)-methyltransferase [Ktedonobacteraceae bacterium]|jgi:DNA (cytosine-5)-methyltransferase 1
MNFIDLFAGLGGFHLALQRLGHRCVFACEIDSDLRKLYETNFDLVPTGDIRNITPLEIPDHEILCAGFPCQPFSKAGDQQGFDCPKWGDLFQYVIRIINYHKPRYIMLENVPNLEKHDEGRTWRKIESELISAGYNIRYSRLSPHLFGIPQIRDRMFIVGSHLSLSGFSWPEKVPTTSLSIISALDHNPSDARKISKQVQKCLDIWQEFLDAFPKDEEFPSFPIWSMEFGATYPFESVTPYEVGIDELRNYRGSHGQTLIDISADKIMTALPSHANTKESKFPNWKIRYIRQNRDLYHKHKAWIDIWIPKILEFPSSLQKLEWNCKGEERNIWNFVIQFRASGVRIKRPATAPSLIAMTSTQVPIIAWEKRYMTPKECANLQSMKGLKSLPASSDKAFKALGNAVNVSLVEMVAKALFLIEDNVTFEDQQTNTVESEQKKAVCI